ncbi:MAG: 4Fe-4S dicluster domain-containing protein [Pseudomonadota bacterium]
MENVEKKLREEAKALLAEKKVDVVVGYEAGTLPLTATPCFITTPEEADRLVWNPCCTQNLAKFVHDLLGQHHEAQKRVKPEAKSKKVVGVVARGCTSRSLVIQLQEKQYARDEIVILGVPCGGYLDGKKLAALAGGEEIREGSIDGGKVAVKTAKGEAQTELKALLADNCLVCRFNQPVIADIETGKATPVAEAEKEYAPVTDFENLTQEARWAYFEKEMAKCIRCGACRNVCPSCYCRICFADQSQPRWVDIGENPSDTQLFQLMRMYHMVGRCVDCGSCTAVCPMGVDLRNFLKKLDKDAFDMFGHRAGVSMDEPAPLGTYKETDQENFIFEPGVKSEA